MFSLRRHIQHSNRLLICLLWIFSFLNQVSLRFDLAAEFTWLPSSRPLAFVIVHGPLTPSCCSLLCPWPSAVVFILRSLTRRGYSHISTLPHPTLTLEISVSTQPHFQWSLDTYNPVIHPPKLTQSWPDDYSKKCSNPYISLSSGLESQFEK